MQAEATLDAGAIIAILRGVTPDRVEEIGDILFAAGIRAIEVPLNSPEPFQSIAKLASRLGPRCLCGAGTVTVLDDVARVVDAGGRLLVAPNSDPVIIEAALKKGLLPMPGFMTPSEAFTAIAAGATHLKLFPAATCGTAYLRALGAALPVGVRVYAVGGVGADDMAGWLQAGAAGFGLGSELFKPGFDNDEIARRARKMVAAAANTGTA
jgi:2-dehydro-3-deoxyphosphogalactonate aldolase